MAQVPMRVAHQAGIVHQQRPAIMVSMQQPPPNTMTGLVSMSPMMAPSVVMAHGPPPPLAHQELEAAHHLAAHPQPFHPHAHLAAVAPQMQPHPQLSAPPLAAEPPPPPPQQPPQQPPPQQQQQPPQQAQQQAAAAGATGGTPVVGQILSSNAEDGATAGAAGGSADGKEKTPMCLINELARYNKIQHQYRLTDEHGPAHKKTFTVILQLGQEEYQATGPSIKKAQHAAASNALQATKFKHPPPKQQRSTRTSLTPTVELNSLAMKRNETAMYTFIESPYLPHSHINYRVNYQRFGRGGLSYTPQYHVSLRVGEREFFGVGANPQAARHASAAQALKVLRDLPLPGHVQGATSAGSDDPNADLKSPISLVHEIGLKRSLSVGFTVTRETGPPHMRTFLTQCFCGDITTDGEGSSKKLSKKRAAELMLDELKKLPALPAVPSITKVKRKPNATKKKSRNLIKVTPEEQKCSPDPHQGINPISRLIQIQQAKKEREPVYTLVDERGMARRREFVMSVSAGGHTCSGTGPNKKLAKRAAAEALLVELGYSRPQPPVGRPSLKQAGTESEPADRSRRVTFQEGAAPAEPAPVPAPTPAPAVGRQLVPGLILVPQQATATGPSGGSAAQAMAAAAKEMTKAAPAEPAAAAAPQPAVHAPPRQPAAAPAPQPAPAPAPAPIPAAAPAVVSSVRPKQQLLYLAKVLGFQVQFTDIPRGNKSEFLSLVSLSTQPPQMSHGSGPTVEAAHDQAALTALTGLTELGLDNVTNGSPSSPAGGSADRAAGDGQTGSDDGADGPHVTAQ
ncbi:double-stranded RNA-binding protein Staufen homolog 2-like isoform X2 [Amphibalanus amphitrite]|uniref:double-stranded RNA-binding protein Staufen homolog 2-like isoform X2 n=1 Tax=Amphibalanus amphitrite TaxID=1232801 RepID=UPI001C90D7D2|nr:double-stranded RNA-binding protein Staufen homolog 2-like isoform X2 [Amphibalanus amphitrite]